MKRALLLHGSRQTPVTVLETVDGGLIVRLNGQELFSLQPVANPLEQEITVQDLSHLPAARKLELLIDRFSNSREDMSDLVMDLMDDYRRLTGQRYEGAVQPANQVQQDLALLKPHLSRLLAGGELVRGWQSRIAEILKLPNSGGSFRKRILANGHALREFYFSTVVKSAPTAVENEKRRAVNQ